MNSFFVKTLSILSILATTHISAGNPQENGYNIKITAKGLKEGSTCLLANYYGDKHWEQKDYLRLGTAIISKTVDLTKSRE